MHEQLKIRLDELRAEFEKGQQRLKELETEASTVRDMLLRISGAMQVLQEELEKVGAIAPPSS
jgi:predicted nuclease with TOPRIM domain